MSFRLALALGMTVEDLHAKMSIGEFNGWIRFMADEPLLPDRIDLMGGVVASTLANINRGKTTKPYSFQDFMPVAKRMREQEERALSDEQFATRQMAAFFMAMGKAPGVRGH